MHYRTLLISSGKFLTAVLITAFSANVVRAQFAEPPVPIPINASWTLEKNQAGASFGSDVANAGDVNGDGYTDVLVSAPYYDHGETNEGAVFLYYGSEFGLNATPGWIKEGNQAEATFGYSISSAGDVNNDGYDDVLVGAPAFDNGETNEGMAFMYLGSASGLSVTTSWTGESDQASALYGKSVANAGDVNGDGYDDVIIGSPDWDYFDFGDPNDAGKVSVYYGNATGLSVIADWEHSEYEEETSYGRVVGSAGDVNGDGYNDVMVGAPYWGWDAPGRAFVYYGSPTGLPDTYSWAESFGEEEYFGTAMTSGDMNGDGYSDVVISGPGNSDVAGTDVYVFHGGATGLSILNWAMYTDADPWDSDCLGCSLSAADINNDGFDDLLVGASSYDNGQTNEGIFYAITGSASGLPGTTCWVAQSNQAEAYLGSSVASAGDVNGDGYDDFISGAPNYDNGQIDEGQARVYLGSSGCIDQPVVTLEFTDTICHNDGVITLTAGTPPGGTYTGTGIIGTDQFDTHLAGIGSHTISYVYVDAGGCSATASDILTVSENPPANLTLGGASLNLCINNPVILVANTGTGLTYQWYRNGVALAGETYLALLAYTTGNYQVEVTNTSGCSKLSKKKKVTHSGCKIEFGNSDHAIAIYPNPNHGQFNLMVNNPGFTDGKVIVVIYDLSGRIIFSDQLNSLNGIIEEKINLHSVPGYYQVRLVQESTQLTTGFIVE